MLHPSQIPKTRLGAALAAQTKTDQKDKQKPELITLSGCIVRGEQGPGQYTLDDKVAGTFRLTGTDVRDYIGRRVQIIGGIPSPRRLTISTSTAVTTASRWLCWPSARSGASASPRTGSASRRPR